MLWQKIDRSETYAAAGFFFFFSPLWITKNHKESLLALPQEHTGSVSGLERWHEGRGAGKHRAGLRKFIQLGIKCLEQGFICQQLYTIICGFEARIIGMLWAFASAFGICQKTTGEEGRLGAGLSREPSLGRGSLGTHGLPCQGSPRGSLAFCDISIFVCDYIPFVHVGEWVSNKEISLACSL